MSCMRFQPVPGPPQTTQNIGLKPGNRAQKAIIFGGPEARYQGISLGTWEVQERPIPVSTRRLQKLPAHECTLEARQLKHGDPPNARVRKEAIGMSSLDPPTMLNYNLLVLGGTCNLIREVGGLLMFQLFGACCKAMFSPQRTVSRFVEI